MWSPGEGSAAGGADRVITGTLETCDIWTWSQPDLAPWPQTVWAESCIAALLLAHALLECLYVASLYGSNDD
jgi:hypothetical protein